MDIPNLKVEQAGGSFIPYLGMVIMDIKIPHLTPKFRAKVVVVPDTDYHFTEPALVKQVSFTTVETNVRRNMGTNTYKNVNYHRHGYMHINMSMPVTSHLDLQNQSNQ